MGKQRIEDSVRKLYEALKKQKEVSEYVQEVKKKEYLSISNWMFSNLRRGVESFEVKIDDGESYYMNPVKLRVTKVRRKKMIWDTENLRFFLGRDRYEKVVKKQYIINDIKGLTGYLKHCGVDPKKFKKFINVETEVNETLMDHMLEKGEITETEIKNCYRVEIGEPYFKLTELKR